MIKNKFTKLLSMKKVSKDKTQSITKATKFRTISGKISLMSFFAFILMITIGLVSIVSVHDYGANTTIMNYMSDVNILQSENNSSKTDYHYSLDTKNLSAIIDRLNTMKSFTNQSLSLASGSNKKKINEINQIIDESILNYNQILELSSKRGFTQAEGELKNFLDYDAAMYEDFSIISSDSNWHESGWSYGGSSANVLGNKGTITIDGVLYNHYELNSTLPNVGKKMFIMFRHGVSSTDYQCSIYLTNINLVKGSEVFPIEISSFTQEDLTTSISGALKNVEVVEFNGQPAFKLDVEYNAADGWQEAILKKNRS